MARQFYSRRLRPSLRISPARTPCHQRRLFEPCPEQTCRDSPRQARYFLVMRQESTQRSAPRRPGPTASDYPRCGRPAGPVAKLAGHKTAVVGQRDRTAPGEPSSLGGTEGDANRRAWWTVARMNAMRTRQSSPYCVQKRRHPVLGGVLSGHFVPQRTGWTGRLGTNASSLVRT